MYPTHSVKRLALGKRSSCKNQAQSNWNQAQLACSGQTVRTMSAWKIGVRWWWWWWYNWWIYLRCLDSQMVWFNQWNALTIKINRKTINKDTYPIIREIFINNLSHFGLLVVEDLWFKIKNHIQHAGLGSESSRPVFRKWVSSHLVVNVIGTKPTNYHTDKYTIDGNSAGENRTETNGYWVLHSSIFQ